MTAPPQLVALARLGHVGHAKRCLSGLPDSHTDLDASRMAIGFYCLGTLDLLGGVQTKTLEMDRDAWREWIWAQQTKGSYGSGFRPSPFMALDVPQESYDTPNIIMTYTALLSLAILRDDFSKLDQKGITQLLRTCQRPDGSFSTIPNGVETDLRTLYCSFAISSMLNDWSGVNVTQALAFVAQCRTYEGGYGQSPFCEASGGPTYIAIASIYLVPDPQRVPLTPEERDLTVRWLVQNQDSSGGFRGRTNKDPDACYCFWCGAALHILDATEHVDTFQLAVFLGKCQFKYGGIAKAPNEHPDPYHTYLSLAALSMYSPPAGSAPSEILDTWTLDAFDPLLNARQDTLQWLRSHISGQE